MTIRFYTREASGKGYYIYCTISHGATNKVRRPLGFQIDSLAQWDKKRQRAKANKWAVDINAKISKWEHRFQEYCGRVRREEIDFDLADAFKIVSGGKIEVKKSATVCDLWPEFAKHKEKTVQGKTNISYRVVLGDLQAFQDHMKRTIKLTDVDADFYMEFALFLTEERNNINSTANRKIGRVRTFMEWAFSKNLIDNQRYAKMFNLKGHDSSRFPLTEAEVQQLWDYETNVPLDRLTLNAFLFACETGLRVSDLHQLQPLHVKHYEDADGKISYLDLTQIKGSVHNYIPLGKRALTLLDAPADVSVYSFRNISRVNDFLKRIAKAAGLTRGIEIVFNQGTTVHKNVEPLHDIISFHFARNTYISMLLAKGLQPVFVKDNVGHSDLTTTMVYSKQEDIVRWKETLKVLNGK